MSDERERDDDGRLICHQCKDAIVVDCGYEEPQVHSYCAACASMVLDEIMGAELPPQEAHLKASGHIDATGSTWVQAPPLGCVSVPVARAFAASILRACDELAALEEAGRS